MKPGIKRTAQAGFTLIELIVVIVILGILAATALPKFANLGADARVASLRAASGAMAATASMAHGKYLVAPTSSITVEGATITFPTTPASGYPKADSGFLAAAGLTTNDYTIVQPSNAGSDNKTPVTTSTQIAIIPNSVAGTATAVKCNIIYTEAASTTTAPTFSAPPAASDC